MEVRLWKPGRVNMDLLIQKLKNILQFSLWDLITEYSILTTPIREKIYDGTQEVIRMNNKFYESIPTWLQSGCVLNVPAVKLHTIELTTRHPIGVIIREMGHIISLHEPSTTTFIEGHSSDGVYMLTNEPDSTSISKCFIISNNGNQPSQEYSEDHKDFRESSHKAGGCLQFLPRQRFFIAIISNLKVLAYMYNWSKDRVEDLSKLMTQLGVWLCSRSSFLCGAYLQKMSLFHNQPLSRKLKTQNAAAECLDIENLLTFTPNATPRKTVPNMTINVAHILRDTNSSVAFASEINFSGLTDPVAASIDQIMSIKASDKKELLDKLHVMWQSRGITPCIPLTDETLSLFMKNARIFHFCLTPFVFHPRWRIKNNCFLRDQKTGFPNNFTESCSEDFSWHHSVCVQFLNTYKHHLQTLGYIQVQTAPTTPRKLRKEKFLENDADCKLYMQKSLIGGIVMLEISISEPFLQIKLLGIECARLQPKPLNTLIPQIVLNFTEECSKVTSTVRLQSFTYDYHLKCIERYLLGQTSYLPRDYHVTSFLEDFLKFYPNLPASSSCCLHTGVSMTANISTSPAQLYDFLLGHEKDYGMEVVRMINHDGVSRSNIYRTVQENEFILVKHQADEFENNNSGGDPHARLKDLNFTLVISCDKFSTGMTIRLNYFLILTSSRLESYSSQHCAPDQVLVNVLADQAAKAKIEIEQMVTKGSLDCRIHLLWNRLLCNSPSNSLSYSSLYELKSLAHIETFIEIDPNLKSLLDQPFQWYQSLVKTLTNKYSSDKCKIFSSPDGTVHHLLVLHPRFLDGFVSLTLDHSVNEGVLSIVYRQTDKRKRDLESECIQSLVEGVVNTCCYHTWLCLLNS